MGRKDIHGESTHGKRTKEYYTWQSIKKRCMNPKSKHYRNYGGRGIMVCKRWAVSFMNFLADMGRAPSPKHSIERIKNNRNYTPRNCKWATMLEQASNKRNNIKVNVNGMNVSLKQACKDLNLNYRRTHQRIHILNWSIEKALYTPRQNTGIDNGAIFEEVRA